MDRFIVAGLLAFIVTVHLINEVSSNPPCQGNGFGGCESNFLGGRAPTGLEIFSTGKGQNKNLANLCEGKAVAILYDCNKRIPLYAATVMTGDQLNSAEYSRPSTGFRQSSCLSPHYQQCRSDYLNSDDRETCYHTEAGSSVVDSRWVNSNAGSPANCKAEMPANSNAERSAKRAGREQIPDAKKVAVHKGHLIAAAYGRGNPGKPEATFVYTNVVPQFGTFNSGQWMRYERGLVQWGRENCALTNAVNVKLYIIVGAIPSTYPFRGAAYPRYFGSKGFSDYMDDGSFRINVPSHMWTAACCTFQLQNVHETRHTGFWRENGPTKEPCKHEIKELFPEHSSINLFPASPEFGCSDSKNYRPIKGA